MNRQDITRRLYTLAVSGINILVQTMFMTMVWKQYYNPCIRIPFWTRGHWYIMTLYFAMLMFFTHVYGGMKIGYLKRFDILLSQGVATVCASVLFYGEIFLLAYRFLTIVPIAAVTVVNIAFSVAWTWIAAKAYSRLFPPHRILLIYGRQKDEEARKKIMERQDKFLVVDSLDAETQMDEIRVRIRAGSSGFYTGAPGYGTKAFGGAMPAYTAVMLWDVPNFIRNEILKECYGRRIRIYTMPSISDILLSGSEIMHFFDTPLFLIRSNALTLDQTFIKRVIDIAAALTLLIVTSPVLILTALAIKAYDGGPVLYRQIRCSLYGTPFYIYKFRSMRTDAEKDGVARLAQKGDDRITPVGALIRKVRIDELPQLFNVIKGDMSFVGPRPERPEIIESYKEELPEFLYRTRVKAGLTGYAQIYGKYNTVPYDKLKLDLYYIEHYSIWLDLKLLLLTVKIVLTPESTEGV